MRTSIAKESFTVYVLVRTDVTHFISPLQRLTALATLRAPPAAAGPAHLASPSSSPVKPPAPKRSRANSMLSSIHSAVALTTRVLSSSAIVVPGIDFVIRFSGSVSRGCGLIALRDIPAGALITEYAGTIRSEADFNRDSSLPHTHAIRLGNASDALIIDGYDLSKQVMQEIFDSGGFCLPADSPFYSRGVAVMANAPNTPSGRGGPKGGFVNALFYFDDGRALEGSPATGGGVGGAGLSSGAAVCRRRMRCWLVSSKPIAAGSEILAQYKWQRKW